MRILLMGNPNVGKSVIFSRLTGIHTISSNYPGTTVTYLKGFMKLGGNPVELIDVPGSYTLEPTCEAEAVACRLLQSGMEEGDIVINVVDATNLERNLYLTLQIMERGIPMVIALNLWDDTKHLGIQIDLEKLRQLLGAPVIPTVATSGEGIKELVEALSQARVPQISPQSREERWVAVGNIVAQVQRITHRHHTLWERLADATTRPLTGWLIAIAVLATSFLAVRFVGEGIISYVTDPLFEYLWAPLLGSLSAALEGGGILHDVLVGKLISGEIDFVQSIGLLSSGLYIPLGIVLPYIVAFYLVLGILEDTGYLPRLGVLMDTLMHRIGLHGYAIIPTLLGFGCNVPAIMATRVLESRRERFIVATLISIAVPCASLQAMIIGLVGSYGWHYMAMVYGTLFAIWVILGVILRFTTKGFTPELLIEVPPYRTPPWGAMLRKLWFRIYGFLREAIPIILGAVLLINILYFTGVFEVLANLAAPVVTNLWGLPPEAVIAIIIGFLRKDVALGMLVPLSLSAGQMVVGSVVLAMFFPCIATFAVMARELGVVDMLKATGVMLAASFIIGGLLNVLL